MPSVVSAHVPTAARAQGSSDNVTKMALITFGRSLQGPGKTRGQLNGKPLGLPESDERSQSFLIPVCGQSRLNYLIPRRLLMGGGNAQLQ